MQRAEIDHDGWIRCPLSNKKLGKVSTDGIMLWNGTREICIDKETLQKITSK